jgi:5,10-methenyltetrahydromethanopterin hydrogenase
MGLKTSFTRLYHFSCTMIYFSVVFCLIVASMLQVRIAACKSMAALAKFSTQYAQKALDMLMDMMNDDTEAVILDFADTTSHGNIWMFECAGAAHAYGTKNMLCPMQSIYMNWFFMP